MMWANLGMLCEDSDVLQMPKGERKVLVFPVGRLGGDPFRAPTMSLSLTVDLVQNIAKEQSSQQERSAVPLQTKLRELDNAGIRHPPPAAVSENNMEMFHDFWKIFPFLRLYGLKHCETM